MSEFMVLFVFEVVIEPSQPDSFSKKQVHNPNAELLKELGGCNTEFDYSSKRNTAFLLYNQLTNRGE